MNRLFLQKNFFILNSILFSTALIFFTHFVFAAGDGVNVQVNVEGCNNNYICEAVIGEDLATCPNDCTPPPPTPTSTPTQPQVSNDGHAGQKNTLPVITINSKTITNNSIKVMWSSNIPVNASVTWSSSSGQTGILQEVGYTTKHSILINNLLADTSYSVTIEAKNLYGKKTTSSFYVQTQKNTNELTLIQNFNIYKDDNGGVLTWQNPKDNFEYVRIVKSTEFFPKDPYDGEVIYEGSAQSFFDSEVEEDTRYFYSIFVKNGTGFSTGVGNNFMLQPKQEFFDDIGKPITNFGPIYDRTNVINLNEASFYNQIHFYQFNNELSQVNNTYFVENQKEVLVAVDNHGVITPESELYISYFNSSMSGRSRDYILEYDAKQKKFTTGFVIANSEPDSPFILYVRNSDEIKGYLGYFSTDVLLEDTKIGLWKSIFNNDLFLSIFFGFLSIILFNFMWIWLIFRRKKIRTN